MPFVLLSAIYLSNLTPLFGIAVQYTVLWSLAVEKHFYLIWPSVVRWLSRCSLIFVSVGIVLAPPTVRAVSMRFGDLTAANFYTWCNADGLALGALLSIALRSPGAKRSLLWCLSVALATASVATGTLGGRYGRFCSTPHCPCQRKPAHGCERLRGKLQCGPPSAITNGLLAYCLELLFV
jgi:peptidoglycan/LPS O-acetylase OafA/YrhL